MKKIFFITLLHAFSCFAMHSQNAQQTNEIQNPEIDSYRTFLYNNWNLETCIFFMDHPDHPHAKKLERFACNYLVAALINKHYGNHSERDAARIAFKNTPACALALHSIIHGKLDNFNEDQYRDMNLRVYWNSELEIIEKDIAQHYRNQQNNS